MKHLNRITSLRNLLKPLLVLCGIIRRFLFNKKYSRGSIYGAGVFPFWIYIKFYGKPVYRLSRKLGLNVFFSLMMANILGSAFHVGFFIIAKPMTFVWFIISLIIFTNVFYWNHRRNRRVS